MKTIHQTLRSLCALCLLCALCAVTACHDDSDGTDSRIETEDGKVYVPDSLLTDAERVLLAQQSATLSILSALTGDADPTALIDGGTYEPTYGRVINTASPLVRSVLCDDTEEATRAFLAIVGADESDDDAADADGQPSTATLVTATPDGLSISLVDMPLLPDGKTLTLGTLTFHRDAADGRVGYIDVAIPSIPHLERIDFLTSLPDNGGAATAYYIGDLVYYEGNKYAKGYYLCVQQADNADGILVHLCINDPGGDETKNLDGDNDGCWYPYNKDQGSPTTFDHCKAYVGFILNNPEKVENIKMFLRGDAALKQPHRSGKLDNIFPQGFNNDQGAAFYSSDNRWAAIHYNAYFGSYAWIPAYSNRYAQYCLVRHNCKSKSDLWDKEFKYVKDSKWNSFYKQNWNYTMNVIHFEGDPVSGAMLDYSPTKEKLSFKNDAENVTKAHLGWCYADNDRLYETPQEAVAAGHTPLGIIVYVNDGSSTLGSAWADAVTEAANGFGHALVMAYSGPKWTETLNGENIYTADNGFDHYLDKERFQSALEDTGSGWERTTSLVYTDFKPAVKAVAYTPKAPRYTTGWFVPTAAQWLAMIGPDGLGGASYPDGSGSIRAGFASTYETFNQRLNLYSGSILLDRTSYWVNSAFDDSTPAVILFNAYTAFLTNYNTGYVRPVFAY